MERYINMETISDGKRYHSSDMAKLGCNECEGCSSCCHDVGDSILLDPWDIFMLETNMSVGFEELLGKYLELKVFQGIILPYMVLDSQTGCHFLDQNGRCSIHAFRPGFCRLFPLGRIYEDGAFSYFLQVNECKKERRSKVKISKWLGIPHLPAYETYICQWHGLTKLFQELAQKMEEQELKKWNLYLLQNFFVDHYQNDDLYGQFQVRYGKVKKTLGQAWPPG